MFSSFFIFIAFVAISLYSVHGQSATLSSMLSSSGQQCESLSTNSSVTLLINVIASSTGWTLNLRFNGTSVAAVSVSGSLVGSAVVPGSAYESRISVSTSTNSISGPNVPFTATLTLSQLQSSESGYIFIGNSSSPPIIYFTSIPLSIKSCSSGDGIRANCSSDSCIYNSAAVLSCMNGYSSTVSTPVSTYCGACASFQPALQCYSKICVSCIVIPLVCWFVLSIITGGLYYKFYSTKDLPSWYTWPDNCVLVIVSIIIFPIGLGIGIWWKVDGKEDSSPSLPNTTQPMLENKTSLSNEPTANI